MYGAVCVLCVCVVCACVVCVRCCVCVCCVCVLGGLPQIILYVADGS